MKREPEPENPARGEVKGAPGNASSITELMRAWLYGTAVVALVGFVAWTAWAYYTWPCSRLKSNPIMQYGYTPARCIK